MVLFFFCTLGLTFDNLCAFRTSLTYGHPYMIDIQDCDARLPSSGDPNDLYMDELVRLSIILGRIQKAIYTQVLDFFYNNLTPNSLQFLVPRA